jgi:hypothetical protein
LAFHPAEGNSFKVNVYNDEGCLVLKDASAAVKFAAERASAW